MVGAVVHSAGVQDRDGAKRVIEKVRFNCPRMKKLWADGGYAGALETWVGQFTGWELEIVRDLIVTGPTGTNVMDVQVVLIPE